MLYKQRLKTSRIGMLTPMISQGCVLGASVYDAILYEGEGSTITDAIDKIDAREGALHLY